MRRRRFALMFLLFVVLLASAGVVRVGADQVRTGVVTIRVTTEARDRSPERRVPGVELAVRQRGWWSGGGFEAPEGVGHHGQIVVDVVDAEGHPVDQVDVVPVDCPGFAPGAGGGPAGDYEVETGPCALQAVRHDGRVLARGPVSTAVVEDSDPAYVYLEVPEERYGSIGVEVEAEGDGMRVVDVWPGTPAEEAGLAPGDLIVAVEGKPVDSMTTDRFADEITGAEGTTVDVTLAQQDSGTSERTLHLTRTFLQG